MIFKKKLVIGLIVLLSLVTNIRAEKKISIVIAPPQDASADIKEKNRWFSGLSEQYTHFRLHALSNINVVDASKTHSKFDTDRQALISQDLAVRKALELSATHIVTQSYEISKDGKSIHLYAELLPTGDISRASDIEMTFPISDFGKSLDSICMWILDKSGIEINEKLKRFFAMTAVSDISRELKLLGDVMYKPYSVEGSVIDKKIIEIEKSAQRDPRNLVAQFFEVSLYEFANRYEDATRQLKELINIIPTYSALYVDLCKNLRYLKKYDEAIGYASIAEKKGTTTLPLILEGARSLEAMKLFPQAAKAFNVVLKKDPYQKDALLFFAKDHNIKAEYSKSIRFSDSILTLYPKTAEAMLEKGKSFIGLKKYKQAETILKKTEFIIAEKREVRDILGDLMFKLKRYAEAARYYKSAITDYETDPNIYIKCVTAYEKSDNFSDALKITREALAKFPDNMVLLEEIGIIQYTLRDTADAVTSFNNFLKKSGGDSTTYISLGDIYTATGKYNDAFYMYNHAYPHVQDSLSVTLKLGRFYYIKKDIQTSISVFQKILARNPHFPTVHLYIADSWYAVGDLTEALKEYKKVLKSGKFRDIATKRIAFIYFAKNNYKTAAENLIKLTKNNDVSYDVYYYLAISYLHLRKISDAEQYLKKASVKKESSSDIDFMIAEGYISAGNISTGESYLRISIKKDSLNEKSVLKLADLLKKKKSFVEVAELYLKLFDISKIKYRNKLADAGFLFENEGKTKDAEKAFEKFRNNGGKNRDVDIHLARIKYDSEKYKEVIALLKDKTDEKLEFRDIAILGESYFATSMYADAEPFLLRILEVDNENTHILSMLAESYEKLKRPLDAITIYKQMVPLLSKKEQNSYSYRIGELYLTAGNEQEAVKRFTYNISKFSKNNKNYDRLVEIYSGRGDFISARKILTKAAKISSFPHTYRKKLALVCLKLNDKASAVKNLKKYLRKEPKDAEAWLTVGKLYFNRGLTQKSLTFFRKSYDINPKNFELLSYIAKAFFNLRNFKMAEQYFSKAIAINDKDIESLNYLALCYRTLNNTDKLIVTLKKIAAIETGNFEILVELGTTLHSLERDSEAIDYLERACTSKKENIAAHLILASIYRTTKNRSAEFSHIQTALKYNPDNSEVLTAAAKYYKEMGDTDNFLSNITKAIKADTTNGIAKYEYADFFFLKRKFADAYKYSLAAYKLVPYNPEVLTLHAMAAYKTGKLGEALQVIKEAIALNPKRVATLSAAGKIMIVAEMDDEAEKILTKAIAQTDTCSACYLKLGDINMKKMKCAISVGYYQRAINAGGKTESNMMKLARALILSYKNESAKKILTEIIDHDPNNREAYYRLLHIYIQEGNVKKAVYLSNKYKSLTKTVWDHIVDGEISEKNGDYERARISYTVTLKLKQNMPDALSGLGRLSLINKDYSEAIEYLGKAAAKDPYNPYLLINLARAYEGIGETESATDLYFEIAEKFPQIPHTYIRIATINMKSGNNTQALSIVNNGLKNCKNNPDLYFKKGEILFNLSNFEESAVAFINAEKFGYENKIELYEKLMVLYYKNLSDIKSTRKYFRRYLKSGGSLNKAKLLGLNKLVEEEKRVNPQ